jgi:sterol desaturase/sphingolipid hydroxylase (fatty acid hydroxylase superfamily)
MAPHHPLSLSLSKAPRCADVCIVLNPLVTRMAICPADMTVLLPPVPLWVAALLAAGVLAVRAAVPRGRTRPVGARALARALMPRRILSSRSGRLDIASFLFSMLVAGAVLGWALVSANWWTGLTQHALADVPALPLSVPTPLAAVLMTLVLFIAYELAYWTNHWLSHHVAWLWAFHKVHHTAESLSLLTNFRVHPVDTIVFYNMASALAGVTAGIMRHLFGPGMTEVSVGGANLLVFLGSIVLSYLQHSHLWIATTGRWGRLILSPAHHQLHHSTDPRHHNRNLGSTIGLFDWVFGTLLVPTSKRQNLRFGIASLDHDPHGFKGALLVPFAEASRGLLPRTRRPSRLAGPEYAIKGG